MYLPRGITTAACVSLVLLSTAACRSGDAGSDSATDGQVRLYGTDGNMSNSFAASFKGQPGALAGMKGTAPLTPLSDDFLRRIHEIDPALDDYMYAAETYDAVVISSLAAELAGTTTPVEVAKYINGVTTGGQNCDNVKQCLELAKAGTDLAYRGVSLRRGGFTDAGEPSTATFAMLHYDETGKVDSGKTEYVGAGDASMTTKAQTPDPRAANARRPNEVKAPLKIGGLLPKTGDLALHYPPMIASAQLALKEINGAGGVLGAPVVWADGDDGTDPKVAAATVQRHLDAGVEVIIGAGGSGVTREVLPTVVKAGRILFSSSNTAADLSDADDNGLYFRTAPSDLLQGQALADAMMRDSTQRLAIIARADEYGEGLQHNVGDDLRRAGIPAEQIKLLKYQPQETDAPNPDMSPLAKAVTSFKPDAVLIIGFAESADVIKALIAAGVQVRH